MNLHWIDWSIIISLLILITSMAVYTKRYTRSVADFLVANRSAGRYLICIADGIAGTGAISIIAMFEIYYRAGFPAGWWDMVRLMIIPTILSLAGWVIYRFRQTRALTLAQFFEMRYSRKFRVFAGIIAWTSGIINFGLFPAVGARFFIYFLGIPDSPLAYALIMAVLLVFSLFLTLIGGQVVVMVTDFIQGIFCSIMFIILLVAVFVFFRWDQITEALLQVSQAAPDTSMLHPFKVGGVKDFNTIYYIIAAFGAAYGFMAWQGQQGYNAAARNPHEARMGRILGNNWRLLIQSACILLLPICAYTFMHHADFASQAAGVNEVLNEVSPDVEDTIRKQVTVIVALKHFLPTGILGGFCAVMLAAFISTHDTYLHSWGSIFIQDIILPFRKKPLSPKQHIKLLRWSIVGTAVFIFLFGFLFRQTEYIIMFFMITGAIFAGCGACLIGGLYWKRGTTAGAWGGMTTGAVMATGSLILQQIHENIAPFSNRILAYIASRNGAVLGFWAAVGAIVVYVIFALLDKKECDLDKLLHRGQYAIADDKTVISSQPVRGFAALIGMGREFNYRDKIIYIATIAWITAVVLVFIVVSIWNFVADVKTEWWITFWKYYLGVFFVLGSIVTIWFAIGGISDIRKMFNRLKTLTRDEEDDGRVVHDQNE